MASLATGNPQIATGWRRLSARTAMGLFACLSSLAGCGDPLVGQDFRGPALVSFDIDLQAAGTLPSADVSLRIALFYSLAGPLALDPGPWVEHLSSGRVIQVPQVTQVNVFEEPGPSLSVQPPVQPGGYALGRFLVYPDTNRNGRHDSDEGFIAIDPASVVLWLPQALPAGATTTSGPLPAGFSTVMLPQRCGRPLPPPTAADSCGVPLGEGCRTDADCGGGTCLRETKFPWPAGYCTITDPPRNGCRPGSASYYFAPRFAPIPGGIAGYYLRACTTDADCARSTDRDQYGYECERGLRACVPRKKSLFPVGGRFEVEPFCPSRQ